MGGAKASPMPMTPLFTESSMPALPFGAIMSSASLMTGKYSPVVSACTTRAATMTGKHQATNPRNDPTRPVTSPNSITLRRPNRRMTDAAVVMTVPATMANTMMTRFASASRTWKSVDTWSSAMFMMDCMNDASRLHANRNTITFHSPCREDACAAVSALVPMMSIAAIPREGQGAFRRRKPPFTIEPLGRGASRAPLPTPAPCRIVTCWTPGRVVRSRGGSLYNGRATLLPRP